MAKWNKKIGLLVLNLGLLVMTPSMVNAADCYSCDPRDPCVDPCGSESCFGGYDLGVDFLYWKAAIDDLDWCAVFTSDEVTEVRPNGVNYQVKYHDVCPGWEPGVRVRLSKDACWCDWRFAASYTRVKSSADRSCDNCIGCSTSDIYILAPPLFNGESGQYEYAKADWESTYQTWDVLFSYDIDCNRCHVFSPFFGIEGLILSQNLEATYETPRDAIANSANFKWNSNYFGVGLKVGSDYTYNICDSLKLFARASGTLVVGDDDSSNTQTFWSNSTTDATFTRVKWKDDDCARLVPGYHVQLGVLYESCYCGTEWGFRLGWEFVNWYNVANHRDFTGSGDVGTTSTDLSGSSSPNVRTYGFHGLLAGLELHF